MEMGRNLFSRKIQKSFTSLFIVMIMEASFQIPSLLIIQTLA